MRLFSLAKRDENIISMAMTQIFSSKGKAHAPARNSFSVKRQESASPVSSHETTKCDCSGMMSARSSGPTRPRFGTSPFCYLHYRQTRPGPGCRSSGVLKADRRSETWAGFRCRIFNRTLPRLPRAWRPIPNPTPW